MKSKYTELVLYGSKDECNRTDNVFFPISEAFVGTVSHVHCRLVFMVMGMNSCIGKISLGCGISWYGAYMISYLE